MAAVPTLDAVAKTTQRGGNRMGHSLSGSDFSQWGPSGSARTAHSVTLPIRLKGTTAGCEFAASTTGTQGQRQMHAQPIVTVPAFDLADLSRILSWAAQRQGVRVFIAADHEGAEEVAEVTLQGHDEPRWFLSRTPCGLRVMVASLAGPAVTVAVVAEALALVDTAATTVGNGTSDKLPDVA